MIWLIFLLGEIGILILGLSAKEYRPNIEAHNSNPDASSEDYFLNNNINQNETYTNNNDSNINQI